MFMLEKIGVNGPLFCR